MLGIADRLYTSRKLRSINEELKIDYELEIVCNNEKEISWFCFVPRSVSEGYLLRRRIIPDEGTVFIYTYSPLNLIKPNPEETIEGLNKIYIDATRRINEELAKKYSLNMLGISLGNVLSIRAAGSIDSKIEKLVSITGGGNLGLSAWDSILTKHIAKQSGCSSPEEYEERLKVFSPINYIDKINADEIYIRLGKRDLLIHHKHGQQLANALIKRGKEIKAKIDYKSYVGADHCTTLLFSALRLHL